MYAGAKILSDQDCENIILSSEQLISDTNDDGEISVDIKSFVLHSDFDLLKNEGQKIQAREEFKSYSDEILSGDCCILLLDEYFYVELVQNGALVNLYEMYENLPESAIDYYGLRLGDTPLYKKEGFSSLPKETILCLKFSPVIGKESPEEKALRDQKNRQLFMELVG